MRGVIKRFANKILVVYYSFKNRVRVTNGSNISYKIVQTTSHSNFLNGAVCYGNVQVNRFTSINGPSTKIVAKLNQINIGSFCSIASGVQIQEYYHKYNRVSSFFVSQYFFKGSLQEDTFSKGDIVIEDDVWIGANSVILSGVCIGRGSIIGAGSIVTKDIPRYSIVGGNPARVIKTRFSDDVIEALESLQWWNWDMQKIKKNKEFFNLNFENKTDIWACIK